MRTLRWMIASAVAVALAGCGADEISSAGAGGNVTINNPPPTTPDPTPDPPSTGVQPAASCPDIANPIKLSDAGTITGTTGTYRVCDLPARFTVSSTLPRVAGLVYSLFDRVDVGSDLGPTATATETSVTLTIEPGVVIFGKAGTSWLAVNRGHKIQAVGSPTQPIVFTSRDNIMGLATDDSQGQWGGVVLMGRAPITDCRTGTPGPACDRQTEGSANLALYGGSTLNDSSGAMSYVQIRYSGYVLGANSELQALTLEGVGSGTKLDHIQMHNSSDDGVEIFGGRSHLRNLVITGADDDSVDVDVGYKGTIQYVIAVQKTSGAPDSMIELDSTNANEAQTPRTHLKLANFTFIHRNPATANGAALLFRGGADATLVNGVLTTPMACLRINGANVIGAADTTIDKLGPPVFRSIALSCGTASTVDSSSATTLVTAAQALALLTADTNTTTTLSPTLTGTFIDGANERAVTAVDPRTLDADFDAITTPYIGAVRDANDTWYAGWTCNSATASFGTTNGACTSLPSLAQ